MSNDYFRFRKFTIFQERCAMKVGTDGTLLGAWSGGGDRILDIGTGTGLVAIMMAQRFPQSSVTAIDIDGDACSQAADNAGHSPFADRIWVENVRLQDYSGRSFDAIVCNPPFFKESLKCPDDKRNMARHDSTLTYRDLFCGVARLLSDDGEFSAIIPSECRNDFETEAVYAGMFVSKACAVKTTPRKTPRRYLLGFRKKPSGMFEETELVIGSEQYSMLVDEFYLPRQ